jgi:hypothetical protein
MGFAHRFNKMGFAHRFNKIDTINHFKVTIVGNRASGAVLSVSK